MSGLVNIDLESLVSKEIKGLGFKLLGLELDSASRHSKLIKIYVDLIEHKENAEEANLNLNRNKRGVTLEDCSKISYYLNKVLSVNSELNYSNYTLEVSSPGLERKLFNLLQMKEQIGKKVRVKLISPLINRHNFTGILLDVDLEQKQVIMKVEEQDFCFNYDNIAKANLVYRKL